MSKQYIDDQTVEVVMKKQMKHSEYLKMVRTAEQKGWYVRAYQIGFYSDGTKKRVGSEISSEYYKKRN